MMNDNARLRCPLLVLAVFLLAGQVVATTTIMPLGDSITTGHAGHASYRYPLWFTMQEWGLDVDLVGRHQDAGGFIVDPDLYPEYDTTFDRDHEGYWGWRTDEVLTQVAAAAAENPPDVVLIHLGTNDIGQLGVEGLTQIGDYFRQIIQQLRTYRPRVTVLLAQVIPMAPDGFYGANAYLVPTLNTIIAGVARQYSRPDSPVILVDQYAGFDIDTMLLPDGLHPNLQGEIRMSARWLGALLTVLDDAVVVESPAPPTPVHLSVGPNPCNPMTSVRYDLATASRARLEIYDARGRHVRTLLDDELLPAGPQHRRWDGRTGDGSAAASGVYWFRLTVDGARATAPVTLVR